MGFLSLFVVALMPVLKILLVALVGLFLAFERINLLGATARKNLNNMKFYVLSPALVVAYLADTVTWTTIKEMWFMPVNILLTFIIGSVLGWILVKITRADPHHHGLIIGLSAAGNLGNLFFVLLPAICAESDSPFGDSSTCTSQGDAYAALSMAIGAVYNWSYVYMVIKISNDRSMISQEAANGNSFTHTSQEANGNSFTHTSQEANGNSFPNTSQEAGQGETTEPLLTSEDHSVLQDDDSCQIEISETYSHETKATFTEKIIEKLKNVGKYVKLKKILLMPSIIAAIIGFIIGVVSPLRNFIIGDSAPLRALYGAASLIGQAAVPTATLIMGANLLKGLKSSGVSLKVILGIIIIKFVVLPGIGIVVVKGAAHIGWVGSDSLYQFVLMLQFALPPAMAIGTITQLFQIGQSDCSVIMLWTYSVAAFSLTIWSTLYMSLVS